MSGLVAQLNDRFRQGDRSLGIYIKTPKVQALSPEKQLQLFHLVQEFNGFTTESDPHSEHSFGEVILDSEAYYFKLDYYDPTLTYLSQDPASPNATRRVMTIMHTSEI